MKIKIKDHFAQIKDRHQKLVDAATSDLEQVKRDIALKSEKKAKHEADLAKKQKLLVLNEGAGLDAPELKRMIRELDGQISKLDSEIISLNERQQELDGISRHSFEREDLMVSVLEDAYNCDEAEVVDCLELCFEKLPVEVTRHDQEGVPEECSVTVGRKPICLTMRQSSKRYLRSFRPEELEWIPYFEDKPESQQLHSIQRNERLSVWFDRNAEKIILPNTTLDWHTTTPAKPWSAQQERQRVVRSDFADIAISLTEIISELFAVENNELDLDKSYLNNPLFHYIKGQIQTLTCSDPPFKLCAEQLTSGEIYQRIKPDWDLLASCPWSPEIKGTLALLKYHLENGEKARFWSEAYEGHYGFRLRTRDHSWIEGQIYISQVGKVDSEKMVHYQQSSVQKLGKMLFCADTKKDGRS